MVLNKIKTFGNSQSDNLKGRAGNYPTNQNKKIIIYKKKTIYIYKS